VDLTSAANAVWVIAAGKAAAAMAHTTVTTLGARVRGGLVVTPDAASVPAPLEGIVGQHPQPGPGSEQAGRKALSSVEALSADVTLLVLLSGGASSMLAVPAEGLTLEDKRATTATLLRAGADIVALNTVRKHLSRIKGGRLAAACAGASCTFVLSDVVGDDLSVIASGPTVADPTTYADALAVLDRFGGRATYPPAVVRHLSTGATGGQAESPKPGDQRLARATTTLIGGRRHAMAGAAAEASRLGYAVRVIEEPIVGDARAAGERLARTVLDVGARLPRPACVIASGETTVTVRGRGTGGRNQELALAASTIIAGMTPGVWMASLGTDGIDGPTDAAGAVVDHSTVSRAEAAGLAPPRAFLDSNNSYAFFDALDDLVRTGPSGTNVGDLQIFLLA
jgi:hydroxypyruvate reductase